MDHFLYRNGVLHAEEVAVPVIAEAAGTPCYVYSAATLRRHYQVLQDGMGDLKPLICYAVKANPNQAVIATLARMGAGADVVSEGEFRRALAAGVPGDKVVFSGVGKTPDEMRFALANGVRQFNVESEPELEALNAVALSMNLRAPVALRVNPDVDAKTHEKIATGGKETKFGVPISTARALYARIAADMPGVEIVGVDMHIGSQLTDLAPFESAFTLMRELAAALIADGHAIRRLDLGGGLGVPYKAGNETPPSPTEYGAMARRVLGGFVRDNRLEVEMEPGRLIVANAGILLSRVIYIKQGEAHRFVILDAAMNDLVRPAMYDAWHDMIPVDQPAPGAAMSPAEIVGPVCETGDRFARGRSTPPLAAGDLVAFRSAGAYGAAMASEYNTRPLVAEALVDGDRFEIVRPRPTYDEMIGRDKIPDWL